MLTIAVSGPQASGKTTLAMALGRSLGVPVFSRDPLMTVLLDAGMPLKGRPGRKAVPALGLELQTALLSRQLELGQSCVLECVMPATARELWREMTTDAGGRFFSVECVCSDPAEHRVRFERRAPDSKSREGRFGKPGARRSFDWSYVNSTMRHYRPDPYPDYAADSLQPVETAVTAIRSLIRQAEQD